MKFQNVFHFFCVQLEHLTMSLELSEKVVRYYFTCILFMEGSNLETPNVHLLKTKVKYFTDQN